MFRRWLFLILTALLLAACSGRGTETPLALTGEPLETGLSAGTPMEETSTPEPTSTVTRPPATLALSTHLPGVTFTPTATPQLSPALSAAAIQILSPGPMSKLLPPFTLRGYVIPGAHDLITVELLGEDGRLIFRKLMRVYTDYTWAYFDLEIPFETHAAAELGRIQVSTQDENGNLTAHAAVHVLLQSEGFAEINPPGDISERCTLLTPLPGMEANGGSLGVGGYFRTFNQQPLVIELIDHAGVILASRWLDTTDTAGGSNMLFSAGLIYSVDAPVAARLVVRQFDERIQGNMYLFSQEILVNP